MSENAFLDKGIILGYCFYTDPHHKKCRKYIHTGDTDYFATDQIKDIYDKKRVDLVDRHQKAIRHHIREIKSRYSGDLTEDKIEEIQSSIDQEENPSWRFLRDYYDEKEGKSVYIVTEGLRDIQQEIEQMARRRKEKLYPKLHGWLRFDQHEDVQGALSGLKKDDEEDFWVCLDAHDVAANLEGRTELATTNPADFGDTGYKKEILENTALDDIKVVAARRDQQKAS